MFLKKYFYNIFCVSVYVCVIFFWTSTYFGSSDKYPRFIDDILFSSIYWHKKLYKMYMLYKFIYNFLHIALFRPWISCKNIKMFAVVWEYFLESRQLYGKYNTVTLLFFFFSIIHWLFKTNTSWEFPFVYTWQNTRQKKIVFRFLSRLLI